MVCGSSPTREDEHSNQFLDIDIPTQLTLLNESVQAVCFECGDNMLEEEKRLFIQAHRAVNGRIVVAHNIKGLIDDEEQAELCIEALENQEEEGRADVRIVGVKVARCTSATRAHLTSGYGIIFLTEELLQSHRDWRAEIGKRRREKREAARMERIVSKAGWLTFGVVLA